MRTVEELINALPPEDKKRIEKMAASSKKTIEETVVFLLAEGANTSAVLTACLAGVAFNF